MKFISICGINCSDCDAYIATKKNDIEFKKNIALKWSGLYKHDFKPEDINCDGCNLEGNHIGYCSICEIRKCGTSKGLKSCALCGVYRDCEILNNFLKMVPEDKLKDIKNNLDSIKL